MSNSSYSSKGFYDVAKYYSNVPYFISRFWLILFHNEGKTTELYIIIRRNGYIVRKYTCCYETEQKRRFTASISYVYTHNHTAPCK